MTDESAFPSATALFYGDEIMTQKIVRLNTWIDSSFDEILHSHPSVTLDVLNIDEPEDKGWQLLSKADIYQISAAKDEVPPTWLVTPKLIERCPNLICVSTSGAGYDTVDVQACTDAGIMVVNQAGGNANSVAELAIGLMIAVSRRIVESHNRLKTQTGFPREDLMGHELNGRVLGIVGFGHTGKRSAQLANAFGMKTLAYDPLLDQDEIAATGTQPVSLDELLAASDIVSLHCPRNRITTGMFDATAYKKMKKGAWFITTARGGIHDENALYNALTSGHLAGAGLDVWQIEPPSNDHPLLQLDNVAATYHTAGVTYEARKNVAIMAAQQILQIGSGITPARLVNKEVLTSLARRRMETPADA